MNDYPIYAAGEFIKTTTPLEVINPFTQKTFAGTYLAGDTELESAIKGAQQCKKQLANWPAFKKYEALMQISAEIKQNATYLAEVLCKESGKPMRYAFSEIQRAAQTFLIAAEECKRLPKEYISLDWTPAGEGREGLVKYFPIGLVAGISPFNFPLNLAAHKIAPAIAAGCPIILKPATSTPLSTLELAKIIHNTNLPKGSVSILPMSRSTGNKLVSDERFNLLSFTGSPEVGWKMKKEAGKKKTVLELGGNAGVIVSQHCDLNSAVKKCLVGGFAYSGQICIHAQRFFIHESIFEKFVELFLAEIKKLTYGNPLDENTDVSVMIDEQNTLRVEQWVNEALQGGAQVLCGGKRKDNLYEATVLTNTNNSMKVCKEEVFGPVVTVEKYKTFEEAIDSINNSTFGLQAGVFTNLQSEIDMAFNKIEAGGIIINDAPTFRADHMPYGGIKDSGIGREGVRYAIMDMMEPKVLVR